MSHSWTNGWDCDGPGNLFIGVSYLERINHLAGVTSLKKTYRDIVKRILVFSPQGH